MYSGTEAKMNVHTPTPTPVLEGDIEINSEGTTATTIFISVPGVQANTTSRTRQLHKCDANRPPTILRAETRKTLGLQSNFSPGIHIAVSLLGEISAHILNT